MPFRTPYHMLMRPMPLASVSAGTAALVLIDIQGFTMRRGEGLDAEAARRGITGEFDEYYRQAEAAARNAARILARAREARIGVWHMRTAAVETLSPHFRLSGLDRPAPGATAEQSLEGLEPQPQERVIERGVYSIFLETGLQADLERAGIGTLILCAAMANITLVAAAREAADRGFSVLAVHDASASETLQWHGMTMQGLGGGAIRTVWTGDVLDMIAGVKH